jgi:hypothetical protein
MPPRSRTKAEERSRKILLKPGKRQVPANYNLERKIVASDSGFSLD